MDARDSAGILVKAVTDVLIKEKDLLIRNLHEISITHRLACHLERYIAEGDASYDVDLEYNRDRGSVKQLDGQRIRPDIIVHRRGTTENLICIEVKKCDRANCSFEEEKNV